MTQSKNEKVGAVLVVGGGIAGVEASLDLANAGFYVHLVEKKSAIGGVLVQLDKSYPTNEPAMCVICMMSPNLMECGRNKAGGGLDYEITDCGCHKNIEIHTLAEVKNLSGEPGNFTVTIEKAPRFVDPLKCISCGACTEVCPISIPDEFNLGMKKTKAISLPYARAIPPTYVLHKQPECDDCRKCVEICEPGAVNLGMKPKTITLNVGAVVAAPGFQVYDPSKYDGYHYPAHPNVLTSLEFERMLSEGGPSGGRLLRPSDQQEPKKIAWLQCVGSRDTHHCNNSYCSDICCMYAIKQALVAKEHANSPLDTAIFFMDMRTQGKNYERYFQRAKREKGVRFIRSRVHGIDTVPGTDTLVLRYLTKQGELKIEEFDLVVLSVGVETSADGLQLAKTLGVEVDPETRFAVTSPFTPVCTSKPGVFVCGVFQGPKDIPRSTTEASAAAAAVGELLAPARGTALQVRDLPPESDVSGQEPRVGVFFCSCGDSMTGVIDVKDLSASVSSYPGVAYSAQIAVACTGDAQRDILQAIKDYHLNRVVVAACTPRILGPYLRQTIKQAGLNPYLFEMANIRDQAAWVHKEEPDKALAKAKAMVRGAVARVARLEPLQKMSFPMTKSALVVGGGVAGLEAACSIADMGFQAYLVEKTDQLGGQARNLVVSSRGYDYQGYLKRLINKVENHPRIELLLNSTIVGTSGILGNFNTTVQTPQGERLVNHGVGIMACGGRPFQPKEYLYGQRDDVFTLFELDKLIADKNPKVTGAQQAVFIQCVGSREPERPYCSRLCCTHSVESALALKELNPELEVIVLYRNIRTYGDKELLFKKAREMGVIFIRFDLDCKPRVETGSDGKLQVTVTDPILGRPVVLTPDLLTLASAVLPTGTREMAEIFDLEVDLDGFFQESHPKRRPVDAFREGFFLAGLANSPKPLDESIAEAKAAAGRAATYLAQESVQLSGVVAVVDQDKCAVCLTCVRTCPFGVPVIDYQVDAAYIDPVTCQGCGVCVSECPGKAIQLQNFTDAQIIAQELALAAG